jgi:hypothetical protein
MGTNDHLPNKSQRTTRRRRNEPTIMLAWGPDQLAQVAELISRISELGGYCGLGRNSKGDCLLFYVKLDDWQERVAIESYDALGDTAADLLADI